MPVIARLRHRLGIILPSRDRQGRSISDAKRQAIRRMVTGWFDRTFPGSTQDRMQMRPRLRGRWDSNVGVIVEEVEEIWVYCTGADLRRHKPALVRLAERVARQAEQEVVGILVDSGLELVKGEAQ